MELIENIYKKNQSKKFFSMEEIIQLYKKEYNQQKDYYFLILLGIEDIMNNRLQLLNLAKKNNLYIFTMIEEYIVTLSNRIYLLRYNNYTKSVEFQCCDKDYYMQEIKKDNEFTFKYIGEDNFELIEKE